MDHPQIVGLGFTALDAVMRMIDMPTWEKAPSLVDFELRGGGPIGTACVAAAKLGAHVGFIGTAGNDLLADLKVSSLERHGVDVSRLVRREAPEDQLIMVYLDAASGERIFAGVSGREPLILKTEEIDFPYLLQADFLHLDARHAAAALEAARKMRSAGKRVMFDGGATHSPIPADTVEILKETDILICGSGFAPSLTGYSDTKDAGRACIDFGLKIAVLTDGASGSHTFTENDSYHIPSFPVAVADTTGAGDVFHGAYLVAMTKGWGHRDAGYFATAAAAIKCSRLGGRSGFPTFEETMKFLQDNGMQLPL